MIHRIRTLLVAVLVGTGVLSTGALAQNAPPFGQEADISYAQELWRALEVANLVGPNSIWVKPYEGIEPHGAILTTVETRLTVRGHEGAVVVKTNYMGEGADVETVSNGRDKYLDAVTVMFEREGGYDPDNQNWFWVKYRGDGTLDLTPTGMQMAGQLAKGAGPDGTDGGCIGCHKAAPGDDYLFVRD